jgi:hypothetical protein
MKRHSIPVAMILFSALLGAADHAYEQGRRIDDFLSRIAGRRSGAIFLRKATYSAEELNAWLNLFYTKKYAPEVTAINLELKDDNYLSGTARAELKGKRYDTVPSFLRSVDVRFAGRIESSNSRMRFLIEELAVNNTTLSPGALDEAYSLAQGSVKIKKSIFDWFSLLPGIKGLYCSRDRITFLY